MTLWQRIRGISISVLMILLGVLMLFFGEDAYMVVIGIYSAILVLYGIKYLWFYFRMARHMVGGRNILFRGILLVDFGAFTGTLASVPKIYVLLYLAGTLGFSGIVDLLRANESKKIKCSWKMKTFQGIVKLIFAVRCMFYIRNGAMIVDICGFGFIFSAVMGIINSLRPTPVIRID